MHFSRTSNQLQTTSSYCKVLSDLNLKTDKDDKMPQEVLCHSCSYCGRGENRTVKVTGGGTTNIQCDETHCTG